MTDISFKASIFKLLTYFNCYGTIVINLDEIQNIPGWNLWARRINETTPHKIFLTGSSSKLSSSNLPTELRGRSLTVTVTPLSFKEFLRFKEEDFSLLFHAKILNLTREYLLFRGFPEIVLVEEGKKPLILDEYFQTFLIRDVIERHLWEIFYWKDYQGHEVDFVVRKKEKVENIVQVSFVSSKEEINSRDVRSLAKAAEIFGLKKALFISWDLEEDMEVPFGKIIFTPLYKFLNQKHRHQLFNRAG